MKRMMVVLCVVAGSLGSAVAKPPAKAPAVKAKFYDFKETLIDGTIRRPVVTWSTAKERTRFERLLRLKKSFLPAMMKTSAEHVFK